MDGIRFILVLACMSPLFILWAIRGVGIVPFEVYFPTFLLFATVPNLYLVFRIWQAKRLNDRKRIRVDDFTDNREHLLTFVFAMLIPLYQASMSTENDLYSALCAFLFVVFIFHHMQLYYMNFWFALFGYRVLSIKADPASSRFSVSHVLITRREKLPIGLEIDPLRITDFLLFDKQ
jgi:hypothetical protein